MPSNSLPRRVDTHGGPDNANSYIPISRQRAPLFYESDPECSVNSTLTALDRSRLCLRHSTPQRQWDGWPFGPADRTCGASFLSKFGRCPPSCLDRSPPAARSLQAAEGERELSERSSSTGWAAKARRAPPRGKTAGRAPDSLAGGRWHHWPGVRGCPRRVRWRSFSALSGVLGAARSSSPRASSAGRPIIFTVGRPVDEIGHADLCRLCPPAGPAVLCFAQPLPAAATEAGAGEGG